MNHPTSGHPLGLLALGATCLHAACAGSPPSWTPAVPPALEEQASGTTELLQAVSVVDDDVVWVSGHGGTWARTTDGGATWRAAVVPGADTLQFRDVHALDARTAWLLAAGTGELSRIYRTDDAGATWSLQWTNWEPEGFYDCLSFWDNRRGLAYGDAVDGNLRILVTDDGGRSWRLVPDDALPRALPGESGFAASGLCVETGADGRAWIAAGNAAATRVFLTDDYGRSWRAVRVPVEAGEGAGLTAISMVDARRGVVFGGILHASDEHTRNLARTEDGGESWTQLPPLSFPGAAYGGLAVPGTDGRGLVAVGPGGAAASVDGGESWMTFDDRAWWAVGSGGVGATWISGPDGRIARLAW
ncbi:MAG: oxidoreductase [Gemmatimonadetes bacterium]|nr:oxidoreductase [Gemmatimonadota bacterium]